MQDKGVEPSYPKSGPWSIACDLCGDGVLGEGVDDVNLDHDRAGVDEIEVGARMTLTQHHATFLTARHRTIH